MMAQRRITTFYPFCLFWLENRSPLQPVGLIRQAFREQWWDCFRKPLPINNDHRTGTELDLYEGLFNVHPQKDRFQQAMTDAYETFICHLIASGAEQIVMPRHLPVSMQDMLLDSVRGVDDRMLDKLCFVDDRLEIWSAVKDIFNPIFHGIQQFHRREFVQMWTLVTDWEHFAPGYAYAKIEEVRQGDDLEWRKRPAPFVWANGMNALRYVLNGFYLLVIAARYGDCVDVDVPNLPRGLQMLEAILGSGPWNLQISELIRVFGQLQAIEVPALALKSWTMSREARHAMFTLLEDSRYHEMREELKHIGKRWLQATALRKAKRLLLGIESDPRWRNLVRVTNILVYIVSLGKSKGLKDLTEIAQSGEPQVSTYDMQPTYEIVMKRMFEAFGQSHAA